MKTEVFIRFFEINDALNILTDYGVLGDNQGIDLLTETLAAEGFTLDDFLDELECEEEKEPKQLLLDSIDLYKEVTEGKTPFNASEMVVAFCLDAGLTSSEAHSILGTVETLYEYDLTIQ